MPTLIDPPSRPNNFYRKPAVKPLSTAALRPLDPFNLYTVNERFLQVSCPPLTALEAPPVQTVNVYNSWDGASAIANALRDARPLPPALKAKEDKNCPVCNHHQPVCTWEMPNGKILEAYQPPRPFIPQQVVIPISPEHKTSLAELTPAEVVNALLFAQQIIAEQIAPVAGAYPVAFMHLGAVGSSIVHPIMIVGAVLQEAVMASQPHFALANRYWQAQRRDILWEEHRNILDPGNRAHDFFIAKIGGNGDKNRGWLVHSPAAPLAPYHLRIGALGEGTYNLNRLTDQSIRDLGYALWLSLAMLGRLKDKDGQPAINNVAVNFTMLPTSQITDYLKARMEVDIIPQEAQRASLELSGINIVADPRLAAQRLSALRGEAEKLAKDPITTEHRTNGSPLLPAHPFGNNRRPFVIKADFDPETSTHWVTIRQGDLVIKTPFVWHRPWHGLHTTLIVPEGWSSGSSHLEYGTETRESQTTCFACNEDNLGFPHFIVDGPDGEKTTLVTNAYGFSGTQEMETVILSPEIEVTFGDKTDRLKYPPAHLVSFAPQHIERLDQVNIATIERLMSTWQIADKKIFSSNPEHNRLVCFVNLGVEAGASIPHLHTQLVSVPPGLMGTVDQQIALVDRHGQLLLGGKHNNPYNAARGLAVLKDNFSSRDLIAELFRDLDRKQLILFEDENVLVYVEPAPMFPYEVVIRAKRLGASSLRYLKPEEQGSFTQAMDVVCRAYLSIGVQHLNAIDEAAPPKNRKTCWRYGVRILPRKIEDKVKRVGPLDLRKIYLVPVSPEMARDELTATPAIVNLTSRQD